MEPVTSKGGWHWDYYESLVKALTFLLLFCDPGFGLGSNCSHPIPRATGSLSWPTKPQRASPSRKMVSYPTWQQTALLPRQRQTTPHWSRIWCGEKDPNRLHRTVCAPLNTHEELSHPCHKTDALSQDAQANTPQRAPLHLLTDNPHCPVLSLCITSSLTAIPFCRCLQEQPSPSPTLASPLTSKLRYETLQPQRQSRQAGAILTLQLWAPEQDETNHSSLGK